MAKEQATSQGRTAKFYDDALNQRLRELMDTREVRTEDFANAVGISSSAVRMWHTGYARPDLEKIPAICKFFDVSSDYLLGLSSVESVDIETRDMCEKTGLNQGALLNLLRIASSTAEKDSFLSQTTGAEILWLLNNLLEDLPLLMKLAGASNSYAQMRHLADEPLGESVDDGTVVALMKMGLEKFGATFNFTTGHETAETQLFLCQRYFTELIESIPTPAWLLNPTINATEQEDENG